MAVPKMKLLESRLATLENEVAKLKESVAKPVADELPWWEKHWGIFDNDPDYEKAMELGRKYRESLRPKPVKKRARKKTVKAQAKNGKR
jgi:hypothetical protein